MRKFIRIVADTNDADYVSSMEPVTDEQINLLLPMIKALKGLSSRTRPRRRTGRWTRSVTTTFCTGECFGSLGEKSPEELYVETGLVSGMPGCVRGTDADFRGQGTIR